MKARYSMVFVAVFAAIASLCAVREAAAAEAKTVIWMGSGMIVEAYVPPQFVAQMDELETRHEVLAAQGRDDESGNVYRFHLANRHAARTQIVGFERAADGVPQFVFHAMEQDARNILAMNNNLNDMDRILYPPPPGLELAIENARRSAASASTTVQASLKPPEGKRLIFEGSGMAVEVDVPKEFIAALDGLMLLEMLWKEKCNPSPQFILQLEEQGIVDALTAVKIAAGKSSVDFSMNDGEVSPSRIVAYNRNAEDDGGAPKFVIQVTPEDGEKINSMLRQGAVAHRVSPPPSDSDMNLAFRNECNCEEPPPAAAVIPAAPAPTPTPAPKEKFVMHDYAGRPIRGKETDMRRNNMGFDMNHGVSQEELDQLTAEDWAEIMAGDM